MMRRIILASIIYATYALQPPFPSHLDVSVTDAAGRVVSATKYVKPTGSQNGNRKRKRVRRVYRKPVTVYVEPDIIRVLTMDEMERERRAREVVRWVTWF